MADQLALRGTVELRVLVDEKGNVAEVKVDRVVCRQKGGQDVAVFGAGQIKEFERILVDVAKKSTARWRFTPPTKLGVPVRVWTPAQIEF